MIRASNELYNSDEREEPMTFKIAMELFNLMITQEIDSEPVSTLPVGFDSHRPDAQLYLAALENDQQLRALGRGMRAAMYLSLTIYDRHNGDEDTAADEMISSDIPYVQEIGKALKNHNYCDLAI